MHADAGREGNMRLVVALVGVIVCDENPVMLSPRVEWPPPCDTETTPGPLCLTASAGHPTGSQARPLGGHTGLSPRGGLPADPRTRTRRTHAPRVAHVRSIRSFDPALPSLGRPRVVPAAPNFSHQGQHRPFARTRPLNVPSRLAEEGGEGLSLARSTQSLHIAPSRGGKHARQQGRPQNAPAQLASGTA